MVKARTWLALVIVSVGTVAATVSCGSDEATGSGGGLITGGSGGVGGRSAVGRAGSGGASSSGAGSSGTTAVGGSGGSTATVVSTLGQPCTSDAGCDAGMTCLLPKSTSLSVGGPAGGMCTVACAKDADCDPFEAGAGCINFGTTAVPRPYCAEACVLGPVLDPMSKCHGRMEDMACMDLSGATALAPDPFCLPKCTLDVDCGAGLFCDPGSGECIKTKKTGSLIGAACDPSAAIDTCRGLCLTTSAQGVTPAVGACYEFCSLGANNDLCDYASAAPSGACVGVLSSPAGAGDLGICEPKCNCTSDCLHKGQLCQAWTSQDAATKAALGEDGFCFGNVTNSVELTTCGAGGIGGAGGAPGIGAGGAAGAP